MKKDIDMKVEEDRAECANMLGTLINKLLSPGRTSDVARVATDGEYRQQLFHESGIS